MFLIESDPTLSVGNGELIADKITMPNAQAPFSRTRLVALLRQSLECCSATIVCGRAGTGKTALALDLRVSVIDQLPGTRSMLRRTIQKVSFSTSLRVFKKSVRISEK